MGIGGVVTPSSGGAVGADGYVIPSSWATVGAEGVVTPSYWSILLVREYILVPKQFPEVVPLGGVTDWENPKRAQPQCCH